MEVSSKFDHTITDYPIGTGVLAFRDLKEILSNHIDGKFALDFGCGTGRSSRILKSFGYDVTGVDVSSEMIDKAQTSKDGIKYHLVSPDNLILENKKYNLILLSFVLMEISVATQIVDTLISLRRFLTDNGKIVIINTADNFYNSKWLSVSTKYDSAEKLETGQHVDLHLVDYGIDIKDYYWPENSCNEYFKRAGLSLIKSYYPKGKEGDNKNWKEEFDKAPFVIYILEALK